MSAEKVQRLCQQVIQGQLSITKRLTEGVLKTGTQIFTTGLNLANKLGLGLFSRAKKESEDS